MLNIKPILVYNDIIKENRQITVRIKSLNWQGARYGLEADGKIIKTGSEQIITEIYDNF